MFFQTTLMRVRALRVLAGMGVTPAVAEMASLAVMARQLKDMGGNANDVALGWVVAHKLVPEPAAMEAAIEAAALKASRVNARGYAEKLKAKARKKRA
ncbi:MAG: hypothetical protein AAFQ88_11605 [Pseudomonadota bacterium]